jgi:hypothetical protein
VNTHQPGYVAPDCPEYRSGRLMLNAIHCADYAVGMLMAELERRGDFANTAVIVMGDHTMFPTTENADALGAAALGWFGKVFMAISWPGGPRPGRIDTPGYTPDFAPIALDVLGFKPVPAFAFGSSPITRPDRRRTLVAEHFQILKGRIIPDQPTLDDHGCAEALLERTRLNWEGERLSPCGRKRIVESVEEQMLSGRARPRTSND